MQYLPFCLVPTVLVPFYLITHAIVAAQLRVRRTAAASTQVGLEFVKLSGMPLTRPPLGGRVAPRVKSGGLGSSLKMWSRAYAPRSYLNETLIRDL